MSAPDPTENMDPLGARTIAIRDVKLSTPRRCTVWPTRSYYVRFSMGDTTMETDPAQEKRYITSWPGSLFFDVDGRSIVVEVHQTDCCGKKTSVSNTTVTIEGRLDDRRTIKENVSDGSTVTGTIEFTVIPGNDRNANELQVADIVARANEAVKIFENTWSDLLTRISKFIEFISPIAQAFPCAPLVLKVLSSMIQHVNQENCDEHMVQLAGTLTEVLASVDRANRLRATNEHREDIELLISELTKCGRFIVKYAEDKNFCARMRECACSNINDMTTKHETKLKNRQTALSGETTLQNRLADAIDKDLEQLQYARGAAFVSDKGCTEGTRVSVIGKICGVLDGLADNAQQVCLLTGVAGCGKSAISHEIAKRYHMQGKLGSSYFFAAKTETSPRNLFSTIARGLADHNPEFKSALGEIIESGKSLRTSTAPMDQLQRFIIEPSKKLRATVPLIIVIDGLDQSGDRSCRKDLLRAMNHIVRPNLPTHIRFLITARPDYDIVDAFNTGQITHIQLRDAENDEVEGDIKKFILEKLDEQRDELGTDWPEEVWSQCLVTKSERLFEWASNACDHIQSGVDRCQRFREIIGNKSFRPLDGLYRLRLETEFKQEDEKHRFKNVMRIILMLKVSLSLASLEALFSDSALRFPEIIRPLASLLDGGDDRNTPIRLLHTSLEEFLQNKDSEPFYVDIDSSHQLDLGNQLLAQMNIVEPSKELCTTEPLIIVIDGLDKSGDKSCRQELLRAFEHVVMANLPAHLPTRLPTRIRFLITACPEPDILNAFHTERIAHIRLRDAENDEVEEDIKKSILDKLDRRRDELGTEWPEEDWSRRLVAKSEHLFERASTACDHIQSEAGQGLRDVIGSGHDLFRLILEKKFKQEDDKHRFKNVMRFILMLEVPLSSASLEALFGSAFRFPEIVKPLASLLEGGDDKNTPIKLLHSSLENFLLDKHSEPYYVDIDPSHHLNLGKQLLAQMQAKLKFNMCNLKDSQLCNAVILNASQVEAAIPPHLSYACQYWMVHLQNAKCTSMVLDKVTLFFEKSFLYWLEAISLLSILPSANSIELARQTCTHLSTWAQGEPKKAVVALALEALQFIQVFDPILRNFTLHLYLSAMPQTPTKSLLYGLWKNHPQKQYLITSRQVENWPANNSISNLPFVSSVAYSPDGKCTISGFSDGSIRIWDASTGQCLIGPLKEHTDSVYSIAYSPKGEYVVSGSADSTIRIWNMANYQSMISLKHENPVQFVVYSSSGEHIVSNSIDGTIRIWTAIGQLFAGPFNELTNGNSVTYSSDAWHVVSGSWVNSLKGWNAANGQCVVCPLQGHIVSAKSIDCSYDGKHIAFGLSNASWECAPLQGPQSVISSIANLSEGGKITSGSTDSSIRILDASNNQCIAGPFQRHTSYVFSVYSPDGYCPAFGLDGHFIKVWKAQELPSLGSIHDQDGWLLSSDNTSLSSWIAPWFRSTFYLPFHSLVAYSDSNQQDIGTSST